MKRQKISTIALMLFGIIACTVTDSSATDFKSELRKKMANRQLSVISTPLLKAMTEQQKAMTEQQKAITEKQQLEADSEELKSKLKVADLVKQIKDQLLCEELNAIITKEVREDIVLLKQELKTPQDLATKVATRIGVPQQEIEKKLQDAITNEGFANTVLTYYGGEDFMLDLFSKLTGVFDKPTEIIETLEKDVLSLKTVAELEGIKGSLRGTNEVSDALDKLEGIVKQAVASERYKVVHFQLMKTQAWKK